MNDISLESPETPRRAHARRTWTTPMLALALVLASSAAAAHGRVQLGIGIGVPYGYGYGYGYGWDPFWGPPPVYYAPRAPIVIERDPPVYVQRQPAAPAPAAAPPTTWYYCTKPAGYYPYVQNCSNPWVPVDPASVPPAPPTAGAAPR